MARYYFDARLDRDYVDEDGSDLPSLEHARQEASRVLGDYLRERPGQAWGPRGLSIHVLDDSRAFLLRLSVVADEAETPEERKALQQIADFWAELAADGAAGLDGASAQGQEG